MENNDKKLIIAVIVCVLALWVSIPVVAITIFGKVDNAGSFGDIFGIANALFSAFAFVGIIATIILQHKELKQNTDELKKTSIALDAQVKLMCLSARLSSIPQLIQQEKNRILSIDEIEFSKKVASDHTPKRLGELIAEFKQNMPNWIKQAEMLEVKIESLPKEDIYAPYDERSNAELSKRELERKIHNYTTAIPHYEKIKYFLEEMDAVYDEIVKIQSIHIV